MNVFRKAIRTGVVLAFAASAVWAADVTNSFQDGVAGYAGTRDAYIASESVTANFGSSTNLSVWQSTSGVLHYYFLKWDLSSIPTNASVLSASATLVQSNPYNKIVHWYECLRDWVESQVTWNSYSTSNNWEEAGAMSTIDKGGVEVATGTSFKTSDTPYTFSFVPDGLKLVQSWVVNPSANYGIKAEQVSSEMSSHSREASTVSYRPKLTIVYTLDPQPEIGVFRSGLEIFSGDSKTVLDQVPGQAVQLTYAITNAGAASLLLTGSPPVLVSTASNCTVSVTTQPGSSISSGTSSNFVISVTPTLAGYWSFKASIANNDRTGSESPFFWTVKGVARGPNIEVSRNGSLVADGGTNAVGTLYNGSTQQLLYVVGNTGNLNLSNGTPMVSGLVNCSASVVSGPEAVVAPGACSAWIVSVVPSGGAFKFDLALPNNDPVDNPFNLAVTGTGSGTAPVASMPKIAITGRGAAITNGSAATSTNNYTDFGSVEAFWDKDSQTRIYSIENRTNTALNLTGNPLIALSGANAADFSVDSLPVGSVAAYGVTTFKITFRPGAIGERTALVTVNSTDTSASPYTFAIKGTGYERAMRWLIAGNSFIAPDNVQPRQVIGDLAVADGHPAPIYDNHTYGGADVIDQRYGRDPDMLPLWWQEEGIDRGVLYESSLVSGANDGKKWDYFIMLSGVAFFSDLLPRMDQRMMVGVPDPYNVPDEPNEQSVLEGTAFLFDHILQHSPNCKIVLYEGWPRAPNGNDDWYVTNTRSTKAYWYSPVEAQWAMMLMQRRVKTQTDNAHGQDSALINRIGDGFRVKNWQDDASGLYRWVSSSDIDLHLSSRGVLLASMSTYSTMYKDSVSDIRTKSPAAVTNILNQINNDKNGNETALTTNDWDNIADMVDRLNGKGGYPKVVASADALAVPQQGSANFQVRLSSAPTGTVSVTVTNTYGNSNVAVSAGGTLTFTTGNWSGWQTVTVSNSGTATNEALISLYTAGPGVIPPAGPTELLAVRSAGGGDSVGDGIADWWRQLYFGGDGTTTNSQSCSTSDPDNDGMSNWMEWIAGTIPTNYNSRFEMAGVAWSSGPVLSWSANTGRVYSIYYATNLLSTNRWSLLTEVSNGSYTDTTHSADSQGFYQIRVRLAP